MTRSRNDPLRDAVVAALGAGALSRDELRTRLGDPWDRPRDRDDLDQLLQFDPAFAEVVDGVAFVPAMVEGTSWTVHVDGGDAAEGFVRTQPDLAAIGWWLIAGEVALLDRDGHHLGVIETDGWMLDGRDTDVVLGPDGWLDEVAGGLAQVDVVDGALRWSALDRPPTATAAQIAAIQHGFARAAARDPLPGLDRVPMPDGLYFVSEDDPIHEALLLDPQAFRTDPIPRLLDLYVAAGLVTREGMVAAEGFDWDALHAWQVTNRFSFRYDLDAEQAVQLAALLVDFGGSAASLEALDDGAVARALWAEIEFDDMPIEGVEHILAATEEQSSIGGAWLRARLFDRAGDAFAAFELLEDAVDGRCRHEPALVDLAGLRADRGDAVGAMHLLVQAGVAERADDEEVDDSPGGLLWEEVAGFALHRPRPTAGRNEPCPCGSGRKYKACHLGREMHSLDDRAAWLYAKATRFLRDRQPHAAEELADAAIDDDEVARAMLEGPFIPDLVLHEDGVFAEFVAARDGLLPDDEALLAAQWALVDRGVFEVVEAGRDQLLLRDIGRGGTIRIVNTHPSDRTRPGMMVVGRPLPVGETYRAFSGFMLLGHGRHEALLSAIESGDSVEIVGELAAMLAPPQLSNTDGQDLEFHTITWRVTSQDVADAALTSAGLRSDGEREWNLVRDSKNQRDTIIANLRLDGDVLTAEVNSAERAEEILDLVAAALPDAAVLDVESRPFEPDPDAVGSARKLPDQDDPALRAALAEYVAEYERRWLDESIPALGGRTPREAAADPIGREDVARLLASFPVPPPDEVGQMNPDRLRAALGL